MSDELSELLERFAAASLAELDERAALLRRVDNKYYDADDSERLTPAVETKTENGDSTADRARASIGVQPISLSEYRVGMSLVAETPGYGPQPGGELFDFAPTTSMNRRN